MRLYAFRQQEPAAWDQPNNGRRSVKIHKEHLPRLAKDILAKKERSPFGSNETKETDIILGISTQALPPRKKNELPCTFKPWMPLTFAFGRIVMGRKQTTTLSSTKTWPLL